MWGKNPHKKKNAKKEKNTTKFSVTSAVQDSDFGLGVSLHQPLWLQLVNVMNAMSCKTHKSCHASGNISYNMIKSVV